MLERHPFSGRPRDGLRPGLRSLLADPHVIFYRVQNDTAEIVRVLHGRQDLDELFAETRRRREPIRDRVHLPVRRSLGLGGCALAGRAQ